MSREVRPMYSQVVLILLTNALLWGSTVGSEQCEVTKVNVTVDEKASTYSFHLTLRNSSCSGKDRLDIWLESCDGELVGMLKPRNEGKPHKFDKPGKWRVKVEPPYEQRVAGVNVSISRCFDSNIPDLTLAPTISLSFNYKELLIYLPDDSRVSGWDLDTYEYKKEGESFLCTDTILPVIQKQFRRNPRITPQSVSSDHIRVTHDFDPTGCYCFVMHVISSFSLVPSHIPVTSRNCSPTPVLPEDGQESMGALPPLKGETVTLALTVGLLLLIVVVVVSLLLVGTLCRPQCLSQLLALRRLPADTEKNPRPCQPLLQGKEVLLLHARGTSGNETLQWLKQHLQADFKVHDIFNSSDPERLADPPEWLQAMLLKGPEVKLLLVESAALQDQMHTLFESSTECKNLTVTGEALAMNDSTSPDALLTFALRHILCSELRQDYSRVFVVRFTDAQQQGFLQAEDGVDLLVKTKRYILPCHYQSLREDMLR